VEIAKAAATQPVPANAEYVDQLIMGASNMAISEAIPWLLRLVKEPPSGTQQDPGAAIDWIHEQHEKLARYEVYARGAASTRAEIESHIGDADPALRRAAVLALSALGDRDVLAKLLSIAKDEKEPRVRQAALDAIERIAKSPPQAPEPAPPRKPEPAGAAMD
jgi:HEAT repeat protein